MRHNFHYLTLAALLGSLNLNAMAMETAPNSTSKPNVQTAVAITSPQISVQLWSVKDDVAADFTGTLTKLAAMGFKGVEFAGNFGPYSNNPQGLKQLLDKLGLKASGAHVSFEQMNDKNFANTVAFYQAINCKYLIVPMDKRAFTTEGAKLVAAELNAIQQKLTPLGMHTGYHNHAEELQGDEGQTPWDVIGQNTAQNVVLQQDVAWTEAAGKDPIAYIHAYPGRIAITHYKAAAPVPNNPEHPIIGQDTTDWKALIHASKTRGGTHWLVVEQEAYPEGMTPMQSVEASLKGLQKILAEME